MRFTFSILLLMIAVKGIGATWPAATVAETDVVTAIGLSSDGDTVTIPAGTAIWTSAMSYSKAITLQGVFGSTIISNGYTGGYLITVTLTANKTNQITGLEFRNGGDPPYQTIYAIGANTDARRFRLDHCKWAWVGSGGPLKLDTVLGVMDHCTIYGNAPGNQVAHIKNSNYNGLTRGNGAWTNATPKFGTEDFFFFENNIVSSTNTIYLMSAIDAQAGARYVWRYNLMTNAYVEGHGSEAQYERSTHAVEVYGNTNYMQGINQIVTFYRGGSGVIFSNRIYDTTATNVFKLENNRMKDSLFAPFGGSDGRNHWDSNDAGNPFDTGTCTSAGALTMTASAESWTPSQWVGYTIRKTSGKAVTSINRSGTTLTVVCTGHGFATNNLVSIFGANQQEYNALFTVTPTDANTFICTTVGALPTTPATGTIKACLNNYFSEISANTATQITFQDSIYTPACTMSFTAGDTYEINKVTHAMDQVGRIGGSRVDDTVTPAFPSGWNDQTTSAWYQWSNGLGNITSPTFGPTSGSLVSGTHFKDNVVAPGYVPFTYPHPLVSGVTGGGSSVSNYVQFGTLRVGP